MGQKLLIALAFSYLFVLGCKKKKEIMEELPSYAMGSIANLKIGSTVLPAPNRKLSILGLKRNVNGCQYSDNFSLIIAHSSLNGSYVEDIGISNLSPKKLGIQKVVEDPLAQCDTIVYANFFIGKPDFILYKYEPLKKATNTITLSSYDSKTKEVAGTFDITFVNIWGTPESRLTYPDTIRIHDCQFKTVINE
jgi:hypothetical protein